MKTSNLWKTVFTANFNESEYLYHYTNIDKAIKIINSNSLRFSNICTTNDTSEAKVKIRFEHPTDISIEEEKAYIDKEEAIIEYFNQKHPLIRLLCFSMDTKFNPAEIDKLNKALVHEKDKYYNVLGRGFALPRMWAQYASDNSGVCFIIDKKKLLDKINNRIAFCICGPVKYKNSFVNYVIKSNSINSLYDRISAVTNNNLTIARLFTDNSDFVKYCYFEKLSDWKNENEYRIVALTDTENNSILEIGQLSSLLKGIVLGEKIDPAYEHAIRLLLNDSCPIRKISFDNNICSLLP